MVVYYHYLF